jgi:hypothetical protein
LYRKQGYLLREETDLLQSTMLQRFRESQKFTYLDLPYRLYGWFYDSTLIDAARVQKRYFSPMLSDLATVFTDLVQLPFVVGEIVELIATATAEFDCNWSWLVDRGERGENSGGIYSTLQIAEKLLAKKIDKSELLVPVEILFPGILFPSICFYGSTSSGTIFPGGFLRIIPTNNLVYRNQQLIEQDAFRIEFSLLGQSSPWLFQKTKNHSDQLPLCCFALSDREICNELTKKLMEQGWVTEIISDHQRFRELLDEYHRGRELQFVYIRRDGWFLYGRNGVEFGREMADLFKIVGRYQKSGV